MTAKTTASSTAMNILFLLLGAIIGAINALVIWYYVAHRPLNQQLINKSREVVKLQNQIKFLMNYGPVQRSSKTKCVATDRWN